MSQRGTRRLWLGITCGGILVILALACQRAGGATSEDAFLDGLRERGLYGLAEAHCQERLARRDLADAEQAELAVQWMRTLAEHAVSLLPGERAPLWAKAQSVADDFLARRAGSPRRLLVEFQAALVRLARGELVRQEATLATGLGATAGLAGSADSTVGQADRGTRAMEEATGELRAAIRLLEPLVGRIDQELRAPSGRPEALGPDELVSLQRNVRYQLARALVGQGQCFAPASDDRANALSRAAGLLAELAELDPADPLAWKSRLDQVACQRLSGDGPAAQRFLASLLGAQPPPEILARAQAEGIRLALAAGELKEIAAMVELPDQVAGPTPPELDDARLEAALFLWRAAAGAKDEPLAQRWQTLANEIVQRVQRRDEPYWTRRAEQLLAGSLRAAAGSDDAAMLALAAESSYLAGQVDEALAAYDRAAELAAKQHDTAAALDLGYVAAMIQQKRGQWTDASQRCRRTALADRSAAKAPAVHLAAIENAAQAAKQTPGGSLDQYASLLEEHARLWPEDPTTGQVHWWMGRLRQHQKDWPAAVAAYAAVAPSDPGYARAVAAAADCYGSWLAAQRAEGQPTAELAGRAAAWLESVALGDSRDPSRPLSPLARQAALRGARFWLEAPPDGYARAERLLTAAATGAADAPAEWTSALEAARVAALAGQGRRGEADAVLQGVSAATPDVLVALLDDLVRVGAGARSEIRAAMAPLQLCVVALLGRRLDALPEEQQRRIRWIEAQSLAEAGRADEALQRYQALSARWPLDATIQEGRARLLSTRQDARSLGEALAAWREVLRRSPPGSRRWFEAKYALAELHYRLGQPKQADEVISLLAVLHPELGGPEMKDRFLRLLDRCRGGP